jgi:predicted DNA-binding ribbon-helix-helix protein
MSLSAPGVLRDRNLLESPVNSPSCGWRFRVLHLDPGSRRTRAVRPIWANQRVRLLRRDFESRYDDKWVRGATGGLMKSSIIKRSVIIDGHKTSVSLEDAFWSDLKEIAHRNQSTLTKLVTQIDETRKQGNLSSAIRLFVLEHIRTHH